jgi:hypothetical protein
VKPFLVLTTLLLAGVVTISVVKPDSKPERNEFYALAASDPVTWREEPREFKHPWPTTTTTVNIVTTTTIPAVRNPESPSGGSPESHFHAVQIGTGGDCAGWIETIAAHFPSDQVGKACSVMMCETGGTGDPTIHNPRSSASGLWQFLDSTWESTTGKPAPAANYSANEQTAAAASLWRSQGWRPWSCA